MKIKRFASEIPDWFLGGEDVVVFSQLRLARNPEGFNFPSKCEGREKRLAELAISKAVAQRQVLGKNFSLELKNALSFRLLRERFYVFGQGPSAFLQSIDGLRAAVMGGYEHLELVFTGAGDCLRGIFGDIFAVDKFLGRDMAYAWNKKFGFLTASPSLAGTGLRCCAVLHLAGAAGNGRLGAIIAYLRNLRISCVPAYGESLDICGHLYLLHNDSSYGKKDEELLDEFCSAVRFVAAAERESRAVLCGGDRKIRFEDSVFRAKALLASARILSAGEAADCLSYIRMGLFCGVDAGITLKSVQTMFLGSQPAHMQAENKKPLEPLWRDVLRAEKFRGGFSI